MTQETAAERKAREAQEQDTRSAELDAREAALADRERQLSNGGHVARQDGDGPRYELELPNGETFASETGEAYALRTADGESHLVDSPVSTEHNGIPVAGFYRIIPTRRRDTRAA